MFPGRVLLRAAVGPPSDTASLLARARDGDVRAFEALVEAHLPRLRRYARSFVSGAADADELAQEALVKVYKHLRAFNGQSSFETWLYVVVRHAFLDGVRSRAGRERAVEEPLSVVHARRAGEAPGAEEALEREEERRRLWAALRGLPEDFRTAVVLFDLEGHAYEEVAAILEVPVGTVKSRLSRGRRLLAEALGTNREGGPSNAQGGKP